MTAETMPVLAWRYTFASDVKVREFRDPHLTDENYTETPLCDANAAYEAGKLEGARLGLTLAAATAREAALVAQVEALREALEGVVNNCGECGGYGTYPAEEIVSGKVLWWDCANNTCTTARAALEAKP